MKKYLIIMMCASLLFAATGCGEEKEESSKKESTKVEEKDKNKVLNCIETYVNKEYDTTYTYDLKGENILDITSIYTLEFEADELEEATDYADTFCDEAADEVDYVKKCNAKISGNKIIVDFKYDMDNLDEEDEGFTKKTPIDELKEILEDEATTCKIEEK